MLLTLYLWWHTEWCTNRRFKDEIDHLRNVSLHCLLVGIMSRRLLVEWESWQIHCLHWSWADQLNWRLCTPDLWWHTEWCTNWRFKDEIDHLRNVCIVRWLESCPVDSFCLDERLWGGSPGTCPPIIEKRPCIYHFLPPFPQYCGLLTQSFWTSELNWKWLWCIYIKCWFTIIIMLF